MVFGLKGKSLWWYVGRILPTPFRFFLGTKLLFRPRKCILSPPHIITFNSVTPVLPQPHQECGETRRAVLCLQQSQCGPWILSIRSSYSMQAGNRISSACRSAICHWEYSTKANWPTEQKFPFISAILYFTGNTSVQQQTLGFNLGKYKSWPGRKIHNVWDLTSPLPCI